jgi:hypothetical protein
MVIIKTSVTADLCAELARCFQVSRSNAANGGLPGGK